MSEQPWLLNEPKSWHDLNRALQDVFVLLDYLGTLPEERLLHYFKDTQAGLSGSNLKSSAPPCASYPEFLNRLTAIRSAFLTGQLPPDIAATGDSPALSPVGFVYWSRDFLAAVAAPATADSIRLTQDYLIRRARFGRWRRHLPTLGLFRSNAPATPPILPRDPDEETRTLLARRLAVRVLRFERFTVAVVILTIGVSIYALSGRLILGRESSAQETFRAIDAKIQAQEDKIFPTAQVSLDGATHTPVVPLCSLVRKQPLTALAPRASVGAAREIRFAALSDPTSRSAADADTGAKLDNAAEKLPKEETFYISAVQAHLCPEREQALQSLFVATTHLQSWSSLVTQGFQWEVPFVIPGFTRPPPNPLQVIPSLFGVVHTALADYATERDGKLCTAVAKDMVSSWPSALDCEKVLLRLINRSRNVAESILGSITLYILPVCYGFLGAMAAAMRLLRRKVDASLLSFTDRSRMQQGAILGLLCGGVIGLFASYVSDANAAGGLGISALALLAGYNVDGVFRFLDEFSDRVFKPSGPAKQG